MHLIVGVLHLTRKKSLGWLLHQLYGCACPLCALCPRVEVERESVILHKGALEAETLHLGLAMVQVVGLECLARSGYHLAVNLHLGLQERGLVEKVVTRLVISRNLQSEQILATLQAGFQIVAIHAIEIVRRNRWSVRHELAIYTQTVVCRGGDTDIGLLCSARSYNLAEREREILLLLASLGPHGDSLCE